MTTRIYFDPLNPSCKSKIGGVAKGESLQLNIYCLKDTAPEFIGAYPMQTPSVDDCFAPSQAAYLRLRKDGQEETRYLMQNTPFGWSISLKIKEIGLYYYGFSVENVGEIACGYQQNGYISTRANDFLLTVYSKDYRTPEWFKGGVMYQIFPDRFCKKGEAPALKGRVLREDWGGEPTFRPNEQGKVLNNDFFGGNLKGIQSKLLYLKELGVTTLYLNPIFEAASNHRYDTSNYLKIDPILGDEKDFTELIEAAENQGISLILDGVFNHTGDDSVYFNKYGNFDSVGAYQSKDSPYYNWYSFEEFPDKYSSWWGIDILPETNENSPEFQNFIFGEGGVLKKWLQLGIGGYRLDVADELPGFFLKGLRKSVKESNPNAIIIGEVWEDASDKIAYSVRREYLQGYELDSVMNYPWKNAIIDYVKTGNASNLLHMIRVLIDHYPKQTLDCLMNILGTHDTPRILTILGGITCNNKEEMAQKWACLNENDKERAIKQLKMASVLQYMLPGVPCLYYGDENGMEGHIDPFCRRCFNWDKLNSNLIAFFQKLGAIREEYKEVFKDGQFEPLYVQNGFLYFKRTKGNKNIYAYTNNCEKPYVLEIDGKYKDVITGEIYEKEIQIQPNTFGILVKA